jgi:hypothetical protein
MGILIASLAAAAALMTMMPAAGIAVSHTPAGPPGHNHVAAIEQAAVVQAGAGAGSGSGGAVRVPVVPKAAGEAEGRRPQPDKESLKRKAEKEAEVAKR